MRIVKVFVSVENCLKYMSGFKNVTFPRLIGVSPGLITPNIYCRATPKEKNRVLMYLDILDGMMWIYRLISTSTQAGR